MALNQCQFIGNLGADPEIRSTQGGDKVANFRIAVTEKWKDREGNRKEATEWVSVVIWGALAGIVEQYLRKGSKVFVSGKWKTRKWTDQNGQDRYSTELVLQGFDAKLEMLGDPSGDRGSSDRGGSSSGGYDYEGGSRGGDGYGAGGRPSGRSTDFDDGEIPF